MPPRPPPAPPPLSARALSGLLSRVARWKAGREEPVVGRVGQAERDPFAVLVATLLSLRTRDAATEAGFSRLWAAARTPGTLLALPLWEVEAAIRPVGFYRTKAKTLHAVSRALLERHGGVVPCEMEALLALPGVGRKTANLVLIEGFAREGICVDTHVHRILNWWGFVRTRTPDETEAALRQTLPRRWWMPVNGLLVSFGQAVCRPVGPRCPQCPLRGRCPYPGKRA